MLTSVPQSSPIHPEGTLETYLPKEKHLGSVDMTGVKIVAKEDSQEEKERKERAANKPSMDECLSLYDFEAVAKSVLPTGAWAYCELIFFTSRSRYRSLFPSIDSSGADDEITMRENRSAYQRLWFRPRILRDVTNIDFNSTILGHKVSLPHSTSRLRQRNLISVDGLTDYSS